MRLLSDNRHLWLLGLVYGLAAAAALWLTRFDSGVAFLWGANAILIAALVRTGLQRWWAPLLVCGVVGGTLTGLLGLGWAAALPFAVVNLGESACAAWIMRSQPRERDTLESMRWFARYVVAAGVAGPTVATILATGSLLLLGRFTSDAIVNLFTGHSLGNLTFVPLALMFTGRRQQHEAWTVLAGRPVEAAALLIIVLVVSGGVFAQASNPLLFLPVMAIILVTFRLGRVGAVLAVALLAVVGGVLTAVGEGPMHLVALDDIAARMQFFQFYLAVTVLTVLPVSADLHHRKLLLRRVRLSEERFRMMAEHSSDLMMHIGNDGRFRYMSPSMQQIGGYDPATLIGTPSSALIAPDYLEMVRREHWGTMEEPGRTRRYQYMGVMADGSQRWFETHSRAIIDEDGQSDGCCRSLAT